MADTFVKNPVLYKGTKAQIESATMGENDFAVATDVEFYTKEEVDSLIAGAGGGGLESVTHDASLTGAGTADSPLAIAPTVTAQINSKADQTAVDTLTGEVSDLMADVSAVEADVIGKVAIAQGAENAGKILKVDDAGNATASFANQLKVDCPAYGWEEGTTKYLTRTRSETPKVGDLTIYNEEITEVGSDYIVIYGSSKRYQREPSLDTQASEMLDIVETLANKADVELSNITSTGKTLVANLGMPSNAFIDLTLPAAGESYYAPADGYVYVQKNSTSNVTTFQYLNLYNRTAANLCNTISTATGSAVMNAWVPAKKGDRIEFQYNLGGETKLCRFIYAQGAR